MSSACPRVSVVTINYNMGDCLEKTITSTIAQTYPNLEYIVVDGASRDTSIAVIERYAHKITKWTSERDRNLYDAMNKGVAMATGDWLLFMNSGDHFTDEKVIDDIFSNDLTGEDVVYGNVVWRYPRQNIEKIIHADAPETLPARMFCSHQSLFARTDLLRQHPMDLELLISDYDFLVWCLSEGKRFRFVDRVIASIAKGGRSDIARSLVLRQQQQVLAKYGLLTWPRRIRYPFAVIVSNILLAIREALPRQLAHWMLSRKLGD